MDAKVLGSAEGSRVSLSRRLIRRAIRSASAFDGIRFPLVDPAVFQRLPTHHHAGT